MNRLTIVALLSLISLFDPALGQINKNKAVPEDAVEHFDKPDSTVVVYPNGDITRPENSKDSGLETIIAKNGLPRSKYLFLISGMKMGK